MHWIDERTKREEVLTKQGTKIYHPFNLKRHQQFQTKAKPKWIIETVTNGLLLCNNFGAFIKDGEREWIDRGRQWITGKAALLRTGIDERALSPSSITDEEYQWCAPRHLPTGDRKTEAVPAFSFCARLARHFSSFLVSGPVTYVIYLSG